VTEVLGEKELRSQVCAILKGKEAKVLALRSRARWPGGSVVCDGQTFEVCQVRSVLEFHERVLDAEERDVPLVCLTELSQNDLGLDLVARLFRKRLHSIDAWTAVRSRFQAQEVEANLVPQTHLARALIQAEPAAGYSKVRGRVLTADKAWSCLFQHALGIPADYLDALSLLQWATGDTSRYQTAPDDLKASARERIGQVCGPLGQAVLNCVEAGQATPLSMGLALRAVFGYDDPISAEQDKAAARLESRINGLPLDPAVGREWARSAEDIADEVADHRALLAAEELLDQVQLSSYAHLSDLLPLGLTQRLTLLAGALGTALESAKKVEALERQAIRCAGHRGLTREQRERLEMLPRLVRWLHAPPGPASDEPGQLASRYAYDTAFADWARLRSEGSQNDPLLGEPLRELGRRVVKRLEEQARQFAEALQVWTASGGQKTDSGLMGVEDVLEQVVVPLASGVGSRVLLIVLDGCGWPAMHEILRSLPPNWTLRQPEQGPLPLTLATFPSVTEFSRTSLLAGRLTGGNSAVEAKAFREHGGLRAACGEGCPPVVFHKGDLDGEFGGLASSVESKISESKNKVVAVVLNAIDDHLDRDDQILGHWDVESVKYLVNLLNLAFHSGRTMILASDHGHVLERSSELRKGNGMGGARWQPGRPAQEGEVALAGPRVLCDGGMVVMPWSERLRYTMKKNGYHGGVHPREVLAPLVVLGPIDRPLKGWTEIRHGMPAWWQQGSPLKVSALPSLSYNPRAASPKSGQLALFEDGPGPSDLPRRILDFPLVAQQWKAQKNAPPVEWTLSLLRLLEQHGRQATVVDLSLALNLPEVRFRHLLGQLGPLLTLDGVPMLGLTADGFSVFLNPKPVEDLPAAPAAKKVRPETVIEVERTNGDMIAFQVPLPKLDAVERPILEGLARHGRLTESQLKKITNTKRVAGAVEKLMEKLHKAGFPHLAQAGEGEEGRIYVLSLEALL
jgi:hypothetical protein